MRTLAALLFLSLCAQAFAADDSAIFGLLVFDAARCRPETVADEKLYSGDFKWDYTLPEMVQRFLDIYAGPKRLQKRAYWNAGKKRFELPYLANRGGAVVLPESFVRSVGRHIVSADKGGYIDGVFFPDMGHSHFLIPESIWNEKYSDYPVGDIGKLYEGLFQEPALEILYHTAEQLTTRNPDGTLVDDARTKWRYETRNIVGDNIGHGLKVLQNPQSRANTVAEVPGYFWHSAGFNVSANENGCFSVEAGGKTRRFDLSLFDLEPAPGSGVGGFSANFAGGASTPTFGECESLRRERRAR